VNFILPQNATVRSRTFYPLCSASSKANADISFNSGKKEEYTGQVNLYLPLKKKALPSIIVAKAFEF